MTTKKKTEELVEITEREFVQTINKCIEELDERIQVIEANKHEFAKLYRSYVIDRNMGAKLVYYKMGNRLMYQPFDDVSKVGFAQKK
jgi:hypothetical protein